MYQPSHHGCSPACLLARVGGGWREVYSHLASEYTRSTQNETATAVALNDYSSAVSLILRPGKEPLPFPSTKKKGRKILLQPKRWTPHLTNLGFGPILLSSATTKPGNGRDCPLSAHHLGWMRAAMGPKMEPNDERSHH